MSTITLAPHQSIIVIYDDILQKWVPIQNTPNTTGATTTLTGDITGSGITTITTTLSTVPISKGGTGQTTANSAFNALVPSQTGNSGKVLSTDGTNTSWINASSGSSTLAGLSDVSITSLVSNQILQYNGTSWINWTPNYITGNQTITISGDISGSGTTAITATLPNINSNIGTFNNLTVNAKGQVTAASNTSYLTGNQAITLSGDISGSGTTTITTTLSTVPISKGGTGQITANDALNALLPSQTSNSGKVLSTDGTNTSWITVSGGGSSTLAGLSDVLLTSLVSNQILQYNGTSWVNITPSYLTSNQTITLSGDATGSGSTAITVTLNTVPISKGGTGQTTANAALNALIPSQTGNSSKFLTTDGTNTSWSSYSSLISPIAATGQAYGSTSTWICSLVLSPGTYDIPHACIGCSDTSKAATLTLMNGATTINTIGGSAGGVQWVTGTVGFTLASVTYIDVMLVSNDSLTTAYIRGLYLPRL